MYRSIADFADDRARESRSTARVMNALSDDSLDHRVTEDGRSLGFIAWHIVSMAGDMAGHAGLDVDAPAVDAPMPNAAAAIAAAYDRAARSLTDKVRTSWSDDVLEDMVEAYGVTFTKGGLLAALVKHEIHHRGQMTVLMRQAGLRIPGVYGPAREEWAEMGMPALT